MHRKLDINNIIYTIYKNERLWKDVNVEHSTRPFKLSVDCNIDTWNKVGLKMYDYCPPYDPGASVYYYADGRRLLNMRNIKAYA